MQVNILFSFFIRKDAISYKFIDIHEFVYFNWVRGLFLPWYHFPFEFDMQEVSDIN